MSGHRIAKLVAEYRAEEFSCAVVPYVALKEVAHGMVCLSESRRGLRDVICVRRYSPLWKRVIAWERSRAASGYGIIWGDADRTNKEEFSAECNRLDWF